MDQPPADQRGDRPHQHRQQDQRLFGKRDRPRRGADPHIERAAARRDRPRIGADAVSRRQLESPMQDDLASPVGQQARWRIARPRCAARWRVRARVSRVVALPPATPVRSSSERPSSAIHKRISPAAVRGGLTMSRKVADRADRPPVDLLDLEAARDRGGDGEGGRGLVARRRAARWSAALAATRSASALRAIRLSSDASPTARRVAARPRRSPSRAPSRSRSALHTSSPPIGSMTSDSASSSLAPVPSRSNLERTRHAARRHGAARC